MKSIIRLNKKMCFWLVLLFIIGNSLIGCASHQVENLKKSAIWKHSIEGINKPYQDVFKMLYGNTKYCHEGIEIIGYTFVEGQIYTESKQGIITIELHSPDGVFYWGIVDIIGTTENLTTVKVYSSFWWGDYNLEVKEWLNGKREKYNCIM